jgi:uncharacterized membrane protein
VLRHGYKLGRNRHPLAYALVGIAVILGVIVWMKPAATDSVASGAYSEKAASNIDYQAVQPVLAQRCYQCHGAQVQMKNVRLDSPGALSLHAQAVYQQVVLSRLMPMNNATGITEAERALVGQWFLAGAKVP